MKCIICGREFEQNDKRHLCCSRKCRDKNTRANKLKECDWCGKEFSTETNGKFCSDTCKKEKKNSFRSLKKCKNCGKTFFGFKHQCFCSSECKQEYFFKTGKADIEVQCQNCGKTFTSNKYYQKIEKKLGFFCSHSCVMGYEYKNNIITSYFSKPHQKINSILEEFNIKYKNEKKVMQFSIDIFLEEENKGIEIMGTYWHGDSRKYESENLEERQKRCIEKDKRKLITINKEGIEILYLWQIDIESDIELCKKMINEFIKGTIKNCHSSSYFLEDGFLKEKDIKQYMEINNTP